MKRFALLALPFLAACAPSPDSIKPVPMGSAFSATPCNVVAEQLRDEKVVLSDLESKQRSAAAGDAIGVLLLGIPTSSAFGGDKQGLIAASKGKIIALESRNAACGTSQQ